jgi:hypothetical protein
MREIDWAFYSPGNEVNHVAGAKSLFISVR